MAIVDPGGGGGRAGDSATDTYFLDKPFDVSSADPATINELFDQMYRAMSRMYSDIVTMKAQLAQQSTFKYLTGQISQGQLLSLAAPGLLIVPAVTGKALFPLAWCTDCVTGDTPFGIAGVSVSLQYGNNVQTAISGISILANGTGTRYENTKNMASVTLLSNANTDIAEQGLYLINGGTQYTAGSFSRPLVYQIWWMEVPWLKSS